MQSYNTNDKKASIVAHRAELATSVKNEALEKLGRKIDPPPPLDVLPPFAKMLVEEAEVALGIHPAYSLAGIIFATAAAVGSTHQVEVKPGSVHSACLYMALIGLPNANKSGGLNFALKPIYTYQKELDERFKEEYEKFIAGEDSEPNEKKLIISGYSREALEAYLSLNKRGISIYIDELSSLFGDLNRYGGGGELGEFLQRWSGIYSSSIRKNRKSISIANPFVPFAGTIQPGPLKQIFKGAMESTGILDRILVSWPNQPEKPLWTDAQIHPDITKKYEAAIRRLLALEFAKESEGANVDDKQNSIPNRLKFSPAARKSLFYFFNFTNKPMCEAAETPRLASMHGKFDLLTIRLALVLQMLWYGYQEAGKEAISEATTERAIQLAEWFRSQSLKVYSHLHEQSPVEVLSKEEQRLYKKLEPSFKTKEVKDLAKKLLKWKDKKTQRFLADCVEQELIKRELRGEYSKLY